ncbi:MAG: tRNA (guanosine(46)-N7)-methyltransferase TrmB [Magnetococcus sp. WYHC-3]
MTDAQSPPGASAGEIRTPHRYYGRKKGFVKPWEESWSAQRLETWAPPRGCGGRDDFMAALGAVDSGARLVVEVGSGNGDFLATSAAAHPEDRFVAIELFLEGISALLKKVERLGLTNVRVVREHAHPALECYLPDGAVDRLLVLFPDPWRKTRHHKRRLIQQEFLQLVWRKLAPGGELHLATDWGPYAQWMLEHVEAQGGFINLAGAGQPASEPSWWVPTRFQQKGLAAGRPTVHFAFRRGG